MKKGAHNLLAGLGRLELESERGRILRKESLEEGRY
jgi:hypothetical protein